MASIRTNLRVLRELRGSTLQFSSTTKFTKNTKARGVARYNTPRYPTRVEVSADPSLLEKHFPPSWLPHAEIAGAMSLLLAVNNGCTKEHSPKQTGPTSQPAAAIVAPIFEHGEGRGAAGCMAVNPPAFLSEEDALQVIREEMDKTGLRFTDRDYPVEGVQLHTWGTLPGLEKDWTTGEPRISKPKYGPISRMARPFVADLAAEHGKFLIEFVSRRDAVLLEFSPSTAYDVDTKTCAKRVGEAFSASQHPSLLGLVYDPVQVPDRGSMDFLANQAKAHEESKRLLRLQVLDLVNWLKAQGAI